jgi:aladin
MPEASRALPPAPLAAASHSSTPSVTPAEVRSQDPRASRLESTNVAGAIATRVKAWALALAHGHALPPPIITARDCALVAPLAWHCHQPRLATVDNQGRILIHNDPASAGVDGVKSPSVLRHSLHAGARALAWRPKAGATLAVGGSRGVCVWSHEPGHVSGGGRAGVHYEQAARTGPGGSGGAERGSKVVGGGRGRIGGAPEWKLRHLRDVDSGGSGGDPFHSAALSISGANRVLSALRRLVPAVFDRRRGEVFEAGSGGGSGSAPIDSLAWSPCGRLLAAGSAGQRAVTLWDLSSGECTKVASGVRGVSLLRWSPCGEYLLAAHPHGGFTLWETEGWTSARWETNGAPVSAAAWGPALATARDRTQDLQAPGRPSAGAVVLVTTQGSGGQVLAVHLPQGAPCLVAQLLPVDLPHLTGQLTGPGADTGPGAGGGSGARGGEGRVGGAVGAVTRESADGKDSISTASTTALDIVDMSWDTSGRRLAVVLGAASARAANAAGDTIPGEGETQGPHLPGALNPKP